MSGHRAAAWTPFLTYERSLCIALFLLPVPGLYDIPDGDALAPFPEGHAAHVFPVADRAYRRLCASHRDQALIVSGESGAGPFATKLCEVLLRTHTHT